MAEPTQRFQRSIVTDPSITDPTILLIPPFFHMGHMIIIPENRTISGVE
jgi:hypothetical protein